MRYCTVCGESSEVVGPISKRGKCAGCGDQRVRDAINQIRDHHGEFFQRWRYGQAASVGGVIPLRGEPVPAHEPPPPPREQPR